MAFESMVSYVVEFSPPAWLVIGEVLHHPRASPGVESARWQCEVRQQHHTSDVVDAGPPRAYGRGL